MNRPRCNRCKGPLDFFYDPSTEDYEWSCQNEPGKFTPLMDDWMFQARWDGLHGDICARLEKKLEEKSKITFREFI
jgi:hypothetical protein